MDRDPQERIWPYLLLVATLLALAIITPRYWRWREAAAIARQHEEVDVRTSRLAPQRQRPSPAPEGFTARGDVVKIPGDGPSIAPRHEPSGPSLPVERFLHAPAWPEDVPAPPPDPWHTASRETASGGLVAEYGSPVANLVREERAEEILPPPSPALPPPRLERADLRVAMGQRMAARSQRERAATVWPRPTALVDGLQALTADAHCRAWAGDVLAQLDALAAVEATDSQRSHEILARLEELARDARTLVREVPSWPLQLDVLAAADGLHRRVRIWEQVQQLAHHHEPSHLAVNVADEEIRRGIDEAVSAIEGDSAQAAWKQFLLLDELERAIDSGDADRGARAQLARAVLERRHSPRLDNRQRRLLDQPAMDRLEALLRQAATEPVDTLQAVYAVEQYEQTLAQADAARLARTAARLRWSADDGVVELARRIDHHYRAANVRAAVAGELLNRLLPREETRNETVDESILGSYVAGTRTIKADVSVRLIPDDDQWRLGLEARGTMASDTTSYAGSAAFYTQGAGRFAARKLIVVDHHRAHVWPAEANVRYEGALLGVATSLDGLPIVNRFARNQAIDGYYQNEWAAQQEVEARFKQRVQRILDREAREPLFSAEAQLQRQLLRPLAHAAVEPATLRLSTDRQRITGHWRLAGENQLGGHTMRPWALADSLLSMQIHESAVNNVLAGLRLEGRHETVRTLCSEMYAFFGRTASEAPEAMPDDVTVRFAEEDAVRVRFAEGRMEVILQIAELETDRRVWRDLVVRNYYAPDGASLHARLVRDSSVRLRGERLGVRDQVALRGIFTKIFGNNETFPVMPRELAEHPGLAGLAITQFIVQDGWIGVAIGKPEGAQASLDREARLETNLK